jgi:rhodanese-related sulfurtransferase
MAGMAAQNVLAGDVKLAQWNELPRSSRRESAQTSLTEKVSGLTSAATDEAVAPLLLDVRRADERAKGFIPGSIHIPLDEVRARMNELPRDKEIVVHCLSGQRSYFACRILSQYGFRVRNLTGSYRTWKTATSANGS